MLVYIVLVYVDNPLVPLLELTCRGRVTRAKQGDRRTRMTSGRVGRKVRLPEARYSPSPASLSLPCFSLPMPDTGEEGERDKGGGV